MKAFGSTLGALFFLIGMGLFVWQTQAQENMAPQPGDEAAGRRLFRIADWTATGLTCIHCHADFNEKRNPDGVVRVAHSLFNSGNRTYFYKWDRSTTPSIEEAIRTCVVRWLSARKDSVSEGVDPADYQVRQLVAYLRSSEMVQDSKAKPIDPMWIDTIPNDRTLLAGDPVLGARTFRRSCAICHDSEGKGPAPSLVRNGYSRYQIAKKIRCIENDGFHGVVMPGFPLDRLSDRELINVAAYVYQM